MDSDSDDLYDPSDTVPPVSLHKAENAEVKMEDVDEGEEEGEEIEEDDSDDASRPHQTRDDINFITDQKEEPKSEAPQQTKRQPSTATPSLDPSKVSSTTPVPGLKPEAPSSLTSVPQSSEERPGTDYPGHHTSTIDPNGNPTHPATGKPILSTDFDTDFPSESSKPWRKPGSDITDYFNYGFDEFTWASYCLKQQQMPKDITEIKSQAENLKAFVEGIPGGGMPPMPGLPGAPTGPGGAANGAMPAMPGMPSEADMQQMFAGMMAQGMDPSTMDPSQFMQMMMGGGAGAQNFGGQGQGFATGQGPGQQPPQAGFGGSGGGFDQSGNFGGGGGGGGRGRGRGGRRNW